MSQKAILECLLENKLRFGEKSTILKKKYKKP